MVRFEVRPGTRDRVARLEHAQYVKVVCQRCGKVYAALKEDKVFECANCLLF